MVLGVDYSLFAGACAIILDGVGLLTVRWKGSLKPLRGQGACQTALALFAVASYPYLSGVWNGVILTLVFLLCFRRQRLAELNKRNLPVTHEGVPAGKLMIYSLITLFLFFGSEIFGRSAIHNLYPYYFIASCIWGTLLGSLGGRLLWISNGRVLVFLLARLIMIGVLSLTALAMLGYVSIQAY